MIRKTLERSYSRTIGAVRKRFTKALGSVSSSTGLLQVLYVIGLVALLGGLVPTVFSPVADQGAVIYPGAGSQTIAENVLDSAVILIGGAGIYAVFVSGRQTTRSRMVNLYLGIAILLIAMSVFMGLYLTALKG